jgi:hypothetical protein
VAERQTLLDAIFVRRVNAGQTAQVAAALGIFRLRQMAAASAGTQDFSGRRDFESLGRGLLGFDAFGTSHNQLSFEKERAI